MLETKVIHKRSLVQTRHSHRPIHWMGSPLSNPLDGIGVPGSFFRGGQQFLSAKTQSCSAKKISSQGGQVLQFCSAKLMYHPFVSHCSASLKIGQKLLNDGSKTGKNGSKIGKYMAETKQKWLQTDKLGRKISKV